ncbi:hypothetical protein Tsubulata_028551 [Turnera subulata]|uniref:DUF4219 domain-containing protein n=1 Tax=Turnera subulata TaxID=218843 RepID=A0A9Q0JHY1_9ROSI|nr:hypothetical protein Tsubulata_028551 [Turnera subulata]
MATTPTHIVANSIMVLKDLEADTYENWKACMMTYLEAQDLWDVIDHDPNSSYSEEADGNKDWRKKNAAALLAIQTSCAPEILAKVRNIRSAKCAWDTLAYMKEEEQKQRQEHEQKQLQEEQDAYYADLLPHVVPFSVDDVPRLSKDWTVADYQYWSIQMKTYLSNKRLWDGIIEFTVEPNGASSLTYDAWRKQNFIALRAIQASFGQDRPYQIRRVVSAKIAWDILANLNKFKQEGIPPDDPLYEAPLSQLNLGTEEIFYL